MAGRADEGDGHRRPRPRPPLPAQGTSERFWLNLQSRYELEIERDRLAATLDQIEPLAAE